MRPCTEADRFTEGISRSARCIACGGSSDGGRAEGALPDDESAAGVSPDDAWLAVEGAFTAPSGLGPGMVSGFFAGSGSLASTISSDGGVWSGAFIARPPARAAVPPVSPCHCRVRPPARPAPD